MKYAVLAVLAVCVSWGCDDAVTSTTETNPPSPSQPEANTPPVSNSGQTGAAPTQPGMPMAQTPPSANPPDPGVRENAPSAEQQPVVHNMSVTEGDEQEVTLALDRNDERRVTPRPLRRMNIDQLRSAISRVSNGMGWTERRNNREVDLFDELSSTLGKPDYAFSTEEDLEATVLFQKFLDDAARSVCNKMLLADLDALEAERNGEVEPHEPLLMIHVSPDDSMETDEDAVNANLQTLLKRFHGRVVTDSDAPIMHHWQWLYRTGTFVTQSPAEAWLGVCVGLFTHPHFYMY